ncbi:MAG: hypothetical protein K0R38_7873 [Polyangiaceae bacterium]|nr:hypothetical protein [Polyangiaceae bacterium]
MRDGTVQMLSNTTVISARAKLAWTIRLAQAGVNKGRGRWKAPAQATTGDERKKHFPGYSGRPDTSVTTRQVMRMRKPVDHPQYCYHPSQPRPMVATSLRYASTWAEQ